MPTIHELLDDAQKQCQSLVEEMEAFKDARTLNQKATEARRSNVSGPPRNSRRP